MKLTDYVTDWMLLHPMATYCTVSGLLLICLVLMIPTDFFDSERP